MLEKALQAAVSRCNLYGSRAIGGDMGEVDGARADHSQHKQAQRLQTRLAQGYMWG